MDTRYDIQDLKIGTNRIGLWLAWCGLVTLLGMLLVFGWHHNRLAARVDAQQRIIEGAELDMRMMRADIATLRAESRHDADVFQFGIRCTRSNLWNVVTTSARLVEGVEALIDNKGE